MQAAIGCEQLKKVRDLTRKRRENWKKLYDMMKEHEDIFILPEPEKNSDPSWFGFLVTIRPESGIARNDVTRFLEEHNIQTRLLFSGNLIRHPCFDSIRNSGKYRVVGNLKNTDLIMNNSFWVGVYPGMTDPMLEYMAETIAEAVGRK